MEGFGSKSFLYLSFIALLSCFSDAASPNSFILTSCKPTSYPSICVESLAAFAPLVHRSPRTLAHAALTISANRATEASTFVNRLSSATGRSSTHSHQAVHAYQDCMMTMLDSAHRLRQSIHQLNRLGRAGRPSFMLRLSDVQTWVSAALTDQSMCLASLLEGLGAESEKRVHAAIRRKVAEASRFTSNALTLVNRLGSRNWTGLWFVN